VIEASARDTKAFRRARIASPDVVEIGSRQEVVTGRVR
jgi:hypothetical protein